MLLYPHFNGGNWGTEGLSNLLQVTHDDEEDLVYELFEYRAHVFKHRAVLTGRQCWKKSGFCLTNGFVSGLSSPVLRTTRGFPRAEESLGGGQELPVIQPTSWRVDQIQSWAALDVNYPAEITPGCHVHEGKDGVMSLSLYPEHLSLLPCTLM